jgi:uncharacterized protein (DUF1684 family)
MKNSINLYLILGFALLLIVVIVTSTIKFTPTDESLKAEDAWKAWVQEKDKLFTNPAKTPLSDVSTFKGLEYFHYNSNWVFSLPWIAVDNKEFIWLATQADEEKPYLIAGYAIIKQQAKTDTLWGFKDPDQTYSKRLFFPFSDDSNGEVTYPTGRFMELPLNEPDKITIDFNFAFNPFCAYNPDYICPIPPYFNHLSFKIDAGEKFTETNP